MRGDCLTMDSAIRTRRLELNPGTTMDNEGIGGQGPDSIAKRLGSVPASITGVTVGSISASGGVIVAPVNQFLYRAVGGTATGAVSKAGPLKGIPGTPSVAANATGASTPNLMTFTWTANGTATAVQANTPSIFDKAVQGHVKTAIVWHGRDSPSSDIVGITRAMIKYLT